MDLDELVEEMTLRESRWNDCLLKEIVQRNQHRKHLLGNEFWQCLLNSTAREAYFRMHRKDPAKALAARKSQAAAEPSNMTRLYRLAEQYLAMGDHNKAFETTAKALQRMTKLKPEWKDKEICWMPDLQQIRELRDSSPEALIALLVHHTFNQRFNRASQVCTALQKDTERDLDIAFFNACMCDLQSRSEVADDSYNNAIFSRILFFGLPLELHTENRNKVFKVRWESLPETIFYAKEYSTEEAKNTEAANTALFRAYLKHSIQRIMTLSASRRPDITVFSAAGNQTLDDIIARGRSRKLMKALKEAARLLARIHILGTTVHQRGLPPEAQISEYKISDPVQTDPEYFLHKLDRTLFAFGRDAPPFMISAAEKDNMREGHAAINQHLAEAERDFYKDHNPRNIVIDDMGHAVAIDFESAELLPCQLDLVSLLEFGGDYLTGRQKRMIISEYLLEKEALLRKNIDRRAFMRTYTYAQAQRHLEMIGYRTRDALTAADEQKKDAEIRRREYHIRTAARAIHEISCAERSPGKTARLRTLHEELKKMTATRPKA
ncbi:hypothetical protein JW898_00685 [Candidatus Woesearchaeota archaeon]|nr:hypothetical protein [Candidatus Woesearchaeota archaeon]